MPHVEEISTGRLPCDFHLLRSVRLRGSIVKYLLGQWKGLGSESRFSHLPRVDVML